MKNLRACMLCACISLYTLCVSAQDKKIPLNEPNYNKPRLFNVLPESIPVNVEQLSADLLKNRDGAVVNIAVNSTFSVKGKVVSSRYDDDIQSVVIRLADFPGANFTFTKAFNKADGITYYSGRMLSFKHGDLYELQQVNNQYTLVKKGFYELVNE